MIQSGYDPVEMIRVMQILKEAAGPNRVPEFQSTHPDPENRIERIQKAIEKYRS
jgi:predicted Zn-dependent protease